MCLKAFECNLVDHCPIKPEWHQRWVGCNTSSLLFIVALHSDYWLVLTVLWVPFERICLTLTVAIDIVTMLFH